MKVPEVSFDHLAAMSTDDGMYEHADHAVPREEHGYCVDDVARGLVVTVREPHPTDRVLALSRMYLEFTIEAQDSQGRSHNRRQANGRWLDEATTGDHWGRALWGLGTAASHGPNDESRALALGAARVCLRARSHHPRAMAYAAVGAYEVLQAVPGDPLAVSMLEDARTVIGRAVPDADWPWPAARLTYANALIPEALLLIGSALGDAECTRDGLALLAWLVEQETSGTHLSVVPTGGWSAGESRPGFDQQPIEVAALAEACARALEFTGDPRWAFVIDRCSAWFLGWNDSGLAVYDPATGGGLDGLLRDDVNLNQGAESTLAAIATFQLAHVAARTPAR